MFVKNIKKKILFDVFNKYKIFLMLFCYFYMFIYFYIIIFNRYIIIFFCGKWWKIRLMGFIWCVNIDVDINWIIFFYFIYKIENMKLKVIEKDIKLIYVL